MWFIHIHTRCDVIWCILFSHCCRKEVVIYYVPGWRVLQICYVSQFWGSSINPGAKKRPYPVSAPCLQCFVMFDDVCLIILIAFYSWFFPTCLYCCDSDALKFILYLMRFWTVYIELNRRGGDRAHILGFTLCFLLQKHIIKYYK